MDTRRPEALLLLPLLIWVGVMTLRASVVGMTTARLRISLAARLGVIAALVLALAQARAVLPRDELHVVFCLDRSASLDPDRLRSSLEWVGQATRSMTPSDRGALVVFGDDAQVEVSLDARPLIPAAPSAVVGRDATDPGRAVRLALALLPDEVDREIVLVTDGNENTGSLIREARVAAANGVRISTVHVPSPAQEGEVLVERLDAPGLAERKEAFLVRATVVAKSPTRAHVAFTRNGRLLREEDVDLVAGRNEITLPQRLEEPDAYVYEVHVSTPGDRNPANNGGLALVRLVGEPRALVVLREREHAEPLARLLEKAGLKVDRGGASELPLGRDELARYDLLVVGDVAAERWTLSQLAAVRDYVRDMGGGLLALGGEDSFGPGGFYETPFEEALPVRCDLDKKALPPLALVLAIDRSGSMHEITRDGAQKMVLAREGAVRTIEVLSRQDVLGVVGFDDSSSWVTPLQPVTNKVELARAVRTLEPGGGTAFLGALQDSIAGLEKTDAKMKHVLLVTDGISGEREEKFEPVIDALRRGSITLSTIRVGDDDDKGFLERLARSGGGKYHHASNASELPRLFTKDALAHARSLVVERPFVPVELATSELGWTTPPPLQGFVLTQVKPTAELLLGTAKDLEGAEDGPLLARWRFGLGKSAAFTSDASPRWSNAWLGWEGMPRVFGNLARWLERDPRPAGLSVRVDLEGGKGVILVEAPEDQPATLDARVSVPHDAPAVAPVRLEPVAPGRYRAVFPAPRPGVYFVGIEEVLPTGERKGRGTAGAALAYPREYRDLGSNPALLERVAKLTGGVSLELGDRAAPIWKHERDATRAPLPIFPWLVVVAAVLLVVEIAARRLAFPERAPKIAEVLAGPTTDAVLDRLLARKAEDKRASVSSARVPVAVPGPVVATPPPAVAPPPPPVVAPSPPPPVAPEPAAPEADDFTAQLLKAKRRARKDDRPS